MSTLNGTASNDTLVGSSGDEYFLGDTGLDRAVMAVSQASLQWSATETGIHLQGAGSDTLDSIEEVQTSDGLIGVAFRPKQATVLSADTPTLEADPQLITLLDGSYLITTSAYDDTTHFNIYTQRFAANGTALTAKPSSAAAAM